jgi:hypothetical protein
MNQRLDNIVEWKNIPLIEMKSVHDKTGHKDKIIQIAKDYIKYLEKRVDKGQFNTDLICLSDFADPNRKEVDYYFKNGIEHAISVILEKGVSILKKVLMKLNGYSNDSPTITNLKETVERELSKYTSKSGMEFKNFGNPLDFWRWQTTKKDVPNLAKIIITFLEMNVSNATIEQSFSVQKHIMRSTRSRLIEMGTNSSR